ncbi:MAG: glycosyltransferase family 4 protein [Alphaproteobacteria bacterium]
MKPILLHISNDYPDPLYPDKTKAIKNLIEATPEFRHIVYSLNRVNGLNGIAALPFGEDRTAISYTALPKGIGWKGRLEDVAHWIRRDLEQKNIRPSIVQAHKITTEGMAGIVLAEHFNCPLICDIQSSSDLRVLKGRPDLHGHFRRIVSRSSLIFPYAPWAIHRFHSIGITEQNSVCLPVLPGFDTLHPSTTSGSNKLVTLMRFDDRRNKNIAGTIAAIASLQHIYPSLQLDIYGGGGKSDFVRIMNDVQKAGMQECIHFKGPIDNSVLPQTLGSYAALINPSFLETYGLVFAEALFCGVPVIFTKGQAIDGYFDTTKIGYACNPASPADIAHGIAHVLTNESTLKSGIRQMQESGALDRIRRPAIIETYRNNIRRFLA